MKNDFRKNMNEWCVDCTAGQEPNRQCRGCAVIEIEKNGDSFKIGQPSGFVKREKK